MNIGGKKCIRFLFLSVLLRCLLSQHVLAQDVPQQQEQSLTELSSNIKNGLMNIKTQSAIISEELMQVQNDLAISEVERKAWEQKSIELSNSLMNISEQWNSSLTTIINLETQLNIKKKQCLRLIISVIILSLIVALLLFLLLKKTLSVTGILGKVIKGA